MGIAGDALRMICQTDVRGIGHAKKGTRMSNAGRVLVVEDNETERRALMQILKADGFTVYGAENADKAMGYADENMDVVLSDLHMGDVSGIDLLQLWKKRRPETQVILVTGERAPSNIVEAMKNGAYDYVTKPINPDELTLLIRRSIETVQRDKELDNLRRRLDQKFGLDQIIGSSKQMKDVFGKIQRAAPVDSTVLILGESGTGKELVAQALHHNSLRKKGPFVAVNVAAVPSTLVESELFGHVRGAFTGATDRRMGRFEQADGGTLFVDEIGDFELGLQAKLLRVLESLTVTPVGGHEDRKVDVRVLAATSRDIRKMVEQGTFREDLYYRLNVVQILLPSLRERPDDIPILVEHFLREITSSKHTGPKRISPEVMRRFQMYRWPGNVRELRNTLESMMVLAEGEMLTERDLPQHVADASQNVASPKEIPTGLTMEELERLAITKALDQYNGNRTHAANRLGISVRTLQRKLRQYELERKVKAVPNDMLTEA
jgi:DNA-binding NtrC family response regulator